MKNVLFLILGTMLVSCAHENVQPKTASAMLPANGREIASKETTNLELISRLEQNVILTEASMAESKDLIKKLRENMRDTTPAAPAAKKYIGTASFYISYKENMAWGCSASDANLDKILAKESGYSAENRRARSEATENAMNICEEATGKACKVISVNYAADYGTNCKVSVQAI